MGVVLITKNGRKQSNLNPNPKTLVFASSCYVHIIATMGGRQLRWTCALSSRPALIFHYIVLAVYYIIW